MQLNMPDNSDHRFVRGLKGLLELTKTTVIVLACVLAASVTACGLFLFGKIVWMFSFMFFKAFGQF